MSFTPAIDIGDFSGVLSAGQYVSDITKVHYPRTFDIGSGFFYLEYADGTYVSEGSNVFIPGTLDLGSGFFYVDKSTKQTARPREEVFKTFNGNGANVVFSNLPYVEGDDTREIVFGRLLDADFTASPRSGTEPLEVTFTDTSKNSISLDGSFEVVSWNWIFGDGEFSTEQNPTHIYSNEGIYTVQLVIEDSNGDTDTVTKSLYITVTPGQNPFNYKTIANINPILINRRVTPYKKSSSDKITLKLTLLKNKRMCYIPNIASELWINHTGYWEKVEDQVTNNYGIVNFIFPCDTIGDISNCLCVANVIYNGTTYSSNTVRLNFK